MMAIFGTVEAFMPSQSVLSVVVRWIATVATLGWLIMLCLLLLIGIACSSRCTLLVYVSIGIYIVLQEQNKHIQTLGSQPHIHFFLIRLLLQ